MAFPFIQCPSMEEFVAHATKKYGYVVTKKGKLLYFEGKNKKTGEEVKKYFHDLDEDEALDPITLSNMCHALGIPKEDFGLPEEFYFE